MALDKITTGIINDDAVTAAKIVAGAVEADIRDDAITGAKLANDIAITTTGALTGTTGDFNWDSNTLVVDSSESKVGVGIAAPLNTFHCHSADQTVGSLAGNIRVSTSDSYAIDKGGQIVLGGAYHSNGAVSMYGSIAGRKESGTDAEYGGYLQFGTRSHGASIAERMRIDSSGNVGIGETNPSSPLEITKTGAGVQNLIKLNNNRGNSQADADGCAILVEGAIADNADATTYGKIECKFDDVSQGSIDSSWRFTNYVANNGTEVLSLVGGNVGIGTSTPDYLLELESASSPTVSLKDTTNDCITYMQTADANGYIGMRTAHDFNILTSNTVKMRFDQDLNCVPGANNTQSFGHSSIYWNKGYFTNVYKSTNNFLIDHPLPSKKDTHSLVHTGVESPKFDLIYRDKVTLVDGSATINIDDMARMSEGTFVLLCNDVQCFTTNESDWDAVKGSVSGNILTIECENSSSTAEVSWMVIGARKDENIMGNNVSDENGKLIMEPEQEEPLVF